jgi:hypothetical protein
VVEHDLAKVGVEGSSPFARSSLLPSEMKSDEGPPLWRAFRFFGEKQVEAPRVARSCQSGGASVGTCPLVVLRVCQLSIAGMWKLSHIIKSLDDRVLNIALQGERYKSASTKSQRRNFPLSLILICRSA